ncbi:uncharacterized protein [Lolium perenne]|uniref:uncharacterized protein isoform X1 n=1 Tax=Lolium perenne TaxID=4522 RepID=UPI0021F50704|nr:uncharacterized protein LOC127326908 isoform X1 [Lolium perenne]XP_051209638.1 uncharacterized protein LOC127326908 isoform X1 [Lolium perenne]XP_051209639.1 uncharacterized protein LOC127326908 isoform X1 [Lolium perenne]
MEKVEQSSDLKFLSKIQIERFKVPQIGIKKIYNLALVSSSNSFRIVHDQYLVRSDFVELNQELGDEFLNETNWGMFGLYYGDNRERQLLSCDTLIPLLDASNSGEEEEVELDKDFIYIVGILILMELKKYRDK